MCKNFGFKLQELQDLFSFNRLYQITINEGESPNEVVKNGHNWPMHMLRLSGTDPSTANRMRFVTL